MWDFCGTGPVDGPMWLQHAGTPTSQRLVFGVAQYQHHLHELRPWLQRRSLLQWYVLSTTARRPRQQLCHL